MGNAFSFLNNSTPTADLVDINSDRQSERDHSEEVIDVEAIEIKEDDL